MLIQIKLSICLPLCLSILKFMAPAQDSSVMEIMSLHHHLPISSIIMCIFVFISVLLFVQFMSPGMSYISTLTHGNYSNFSVLLKFHFFMISFQVISSHTMPSPNVFSHSSLAQSLTLF